MHAGAQFVNCWPQRPPHDTRWHGFRGSIAYVMEDQPSIEQRIKAAMALAGIDYDEMADRIAAKKYGARTLRRIADPDDPNRTPQGPDLHVIARACRVSDAFWTVDFRHLEAPDLRAEVRLLEERFEDGLANALDAVARLKQELQAHREMDHPETRTGDGGL
jgi:hypothetical protein